MFLSIKKTFVVKYLNTFEVVTLILLNTLNLTDKIVSTFLFWMFQFVKLINKVPSLQWTNLQYLQLDSCHSGKQLSLSLYISKDVYFLNTQTCTDAWDAYTHTWIYEDDFHQSRTKQKADFKQLHGFEKNQFNMSWRASSSILLCLLKIFIPLNLKKSIIFTLFILFLFFNYISSFSPKILLSCLQSAQVANSSWTTEFFSATCL